MKNTTMQYFTLRKNDLPYFSLCYTWPKKALENAKSYKLNNLSSASKGISKVGRGRFRQLMQVFAVGINVLVTSTNCKLGCSTNPSTGSSSAPVTNCRICDRDTVPLLPPTNLKGRSYQKLCITDWWQWNVYNNLI